jgi:hypothetical protein
MYAEHIKSNTAVEIRCADHAALLYPQKLTLTSLTSGGRSAGIAHSRTKVTELLHIKSGAFLISYLINLMVYRTVLVITYKCPHNICSKHFSLYYINN